MSKTPDLRDLRAPLLAWAAVALVSIFLHGPVPLYSTRSLAVAWEMWDRGSWLVPLFNGAPYSLLDLLGARARERGVAGRGGGPRCARAAGCGGAG